jgi:RNA polymerase-binding transcription factor DksA
MAKAAPTKKTAAKPAATPAAKRNAPAKPVTPVKAAAKKQPASAKPAPAKAALTKKPAAKPAVKTPAKAAAKAPAKTPAKGAVAKKAAPKAATTTKAAAAPAKAPAKTVVKPAPVPKPAPVKKKSTVTCPLSGFEVKPDKPNLSPRTVERLRLKLLEERARHVHQADELQAEAESLANDREGGDTQFDEESGEGDTFNVERERDLLLSATARQIVDEIDHALERIRDKTYGVCVPAGRRISLERLDALPYAETCVECKARAERRR